MMVTSNRKDCLEREERRGGSGGDKERGRLDVDCVRVLCCIGNRERQWQDLTVDERCEGKNEKNSEVNLGRSKGFLTMRLQSVRPWIAISKKMLPFKEGHIVL
jgi:hypothetical protein